MWPWKKEEKCGELGFAIEHLRFSLEREELVKLLGSLGLEPLARHRLESGATAPSYEAVLAQQLRLTELQSPRPPDYGHSRR